MFSGPSGHSCWGLGKDPCRGPCPAGSTCWSDVGPHSPFTRSPWPSGTPLSKAGPIPWRTSWTHSIVWKALVKAIRHIYGSLILFLDHICLYTLNIWDQGEREKKNHKPNQIQPCMLCFLPQSLSAKPTSGCSINVLFKEREFPRSVYLHCLRPCGRAAFWREAHRQLIALKWLFCSLGVCTIARARRLPH